MNSFKKDGAVIKESLIKAENDINLIKEERSIFFFLIENIKYIFLNLWEI